MMACPEGAIAVEGRGISPDDLLPLPSVEERATADALAALMRSRRSVRRFDEREVDPVLLQRIVETAASAPMGIPPWDIGCVIIHGREKVQELAAEVIKGYEKFLKMFRPWVLGAMRPFMRRESYEQFRYFIRPLAEKYVGGHREGRDLLFYDAPAVLIFHHSPYADKADAAIACTYAMLAAESHRLGNTMIGGAPPIMQRNRELCRSLGIPEGNTPSLALIVGYPAATFRRALRRHFTQVTVVGTEG
jgi:nitroreductase